MKICKIIPFFIFAVSCSNNPSSVLLPPHVEIKKIDTRPVEVAADSASLSLKDISNAGDSTREAAKFLIYEIDQASVLAEKDDSLKKAFKQIKMLASDLTKKLHLAKSKEQKAIDSMNSLKDEIVNLKAYSESQYESIKLSEKENRVLRSNIESLAKVSEKLNEAKEKITWWRSRALIVSGISLVLMLFVFRKPLSLLLGNFFI